MKIQEIAGIIAASVIMILFLMGNNTKPEKEDWIKEMPIWARAIFCFGLIVFFLCFFIATSDYSSSTLWPQ
jgi:uncharacterized membrane protein YdjX (TVP38/TMEM64 family)